MFSSFYNNKRVFLTGHTGFKGSWLAEWLLMLGAEVHGFALNPQPHELLFNQLGLAGRLASDTRADLADQAALRSALAKANPHIVLHLAAQPLVRYSYDIPVETFAANVMGTVHVLEAVRLRNTPCAVVCVTTDKCYENREWLHAYREEDAMGGHDPYSASKGAAELVINSYRKSFFSSSSGIANSRSNIFLASARAGNVIGGGDWAPDRIVPDCIRALSKGESIPVRNKIATRPWQHVLEPLSGYLTLGATLGNLASGKLEAETSEGNSCADTSSYRLSAFNSQHHDHNLGLFCGPFNFGPALTSNRTVADLVQEIIRHTGGEWLDASDPLAVHEATKLNLATDKAFHLLGWQPVWNFAQSIAITAEWYLKEASSDSVRGLTRSQIEAYHAAASAKGLSWANE